MGVELASDCGAALDNRPGKSGPVALRCKRCRHREEQRRYKARKKEREIHHAGH